MLLNIYYLMVQVPLTHWRIFKSVSLRWYLYNFAPFIVLAVATFALGRWLITLLEWQDTAFRWVLCALCIGVYLFLSYWFFEQSIRRDINAGLARVCGIRKGKVGEHHV